MKWYVNRITNTLYESESNCTCKKDSQSSSTKTIFSNKKESFSDKKESSKRKKMWNCNTKRVIAKKIADNSLDFSVKRWSSSTCESICHPSKEKSRIEQNRLFPHRLKIKLVFTGYFLGDWSNIYMFWTSKRECNYIFLKIRFLKQWQSVVMFCFNQRNDWSISWKITCITQKGGIMQEVAFL